MIASGQGSVYNPKAGGGSETAISKWAREHKNDNLDLTLFEKLDIIKQFLGSINNVEILEDFAEKARNRNIDIKIKSEHQTVVNPKSFIQFFKLRSKSA